MRLLKIAAGVLNQTPSRLVGESRKHSRRNCICEIRAGRGSLLAGIMYYRLRMRRCVSLVGRPCDGTGNADIDCPRNEGDCCFGGTACDLCRWRLQRCGAVSGWKIAGFVGKQHLAGDGIHYEPRWFKPWPAGIQGEN